ncbi:MAG: 23S rRNA (guanosine(2251)-2'-O)-methyltransferase [uncultured Pyrinomonadaceae bacterium]|uniref:23S rRNA (Guanosine(2251)-2'-O)-methyltransferase n=1 Tax=uncultured Pyrinomonadaceae bacterium TaxID=2283094 RepID=A0A6J4Q4G7_9BACT|nr:MAG: 23S rRNA (guanosine(2251)-2'-O)-methyltransferase [uncultured Pyrinomonadaceae bacterium]
MKKSKVQNSKSQVQSSKFKAGRSFNSQSSDYKSKTEQSGNIIFGVLPVLEALRAANRRIEKIVVADGAQEKRLAEILFLARENGVRFEKTPRENLAQYVESGANHQGVIALVAAADYYPTDELLEEIYRKIEAGEKPLIVILDGVEDPRNLGAILRTVECAGADGVFIPERRAVGLTEIVAKSAAGATEYVKVAKVTNLNRLIDRLKEHNIWVIGTSGAAETNYTDWDFNVPCALILGGEGKGLHRLTAEKCDALVKIPMRGQIESLNVSVACGVILFEATRQRKI